MRQMIGPNGPFKVMAAAPGRDKCLESFSSLKEAEDFMMAHYLLYRSMGFNLWIPLSMEIVDE